MLSGRLRRRALALLGALLLVILIWPPCCATMPKPLPAVLPTVPQIDLPPDPIPAVAVVVVQQQQQQNKSRKVSELSRFMNVLLMGHSVDSGESGPRARSTRAVDDDDSGQDGSKRTLKLPRRENSSASYPIESSIDKNKSNEQQTVSSPSSPSQRLDNGGRDPAAATVKTGSTYYQPASSIPIFSILSQRTSPPSADLQVNDRSGGGGGGVVAVNQSVFNPTSPPTSSPSSPSPPHSRAERSAADGGGQHHHRHQHHYLTGEGTLARRGGGGRHHQQHHHNQTLVEGDSSNLERNERSANLSHITGANRKIQLYIKNRYLQLLADGTVNGTHDDQSEFTILQRTTVAAGQIRIQGVATCLFLCMDTCGTVYGSRAFTDDCVFNEQMEQHHYNTYSSTAHSNGRRTLYLALNKTGGPRKIQIPVNRTLGKLATYTKALTQTVAHDRVERLIERLFGANHVRHGLKQLCETGVLPEVEMRPRPACGAGGQAVKPAGGGPNKDKDSKDTMRKKKKKRRKCREDEQPGEHCFRPAVGNSGSSSSSLGTNSNRRRQPPGQQAKSQQLVRCGGGGGDEGECVDSPSSTTSVSSSNSSNSHNRASTTVPNVVDSAAAAAVTPKKKVAKKVNNRNTPPNVNSKKPRGGGGSAGNGPNKKAKLQQQQQHSSSSISSSTVPLTAKARTKAMTAARMTPRTTRSTTTTTTTSTTTTPQPPSSTPPTLDDTSQSEDEELLDMDELAALHQLGSAEIIEEDELDEGSHLKPSASPWHEPAGPLAQSGFPTTTTKITETFANATSSSPGSVVVKPSRNRCRFLVTFTLIGLSLGCWSLRARP